MATAAPGRSLVPLPDRRNVPFHRHILSDHTAFSNNLHWQGSSYVTTRRSFFSFFLPSTHPNMVTHSRIFYNALKYLNSAQLDKGPAPVIGLYMIFGSVFQGVTTMDWSSACCIQRVCELGSLFGLEYYFSQAYTSSGLVGVFGPTIQSLLREQSTFPGIFLLFLFGLTGCTLGVHFTAIHLV